MHVPSNNLREEEEFSPMSLVESQFLEEITNTQFINPAVRGESHHPGSDFVYEVWRETTTKGKKDFVLYTTPEGIFEGSVWRYSYGNRSVIVHKLKQTTRDRRVGYVLGVSMDIVWDVAPPGATAMLRKQHQEVEIKMDPNDPDGYYRLDDDGGDPTRYGGVQYDYVYREADRRKFIILGIQEAEYNRVQKPERIQRRAAKLPRFSSPRRLYS